MSKEELDIADMQCWVFRMAQKRWQISAAKCADIFEQYQILDFIHDCYDILHLSSYECALDEIERMLKNKGVYGIVAQ